jgi:type II secretory pathway component PulC
VDEATFATRGAGKLVRESRLTRLGAATVRRARALAGPPQLAVALLGAAIVIQAADISRSIAHAFRPLSHGPLAHSDHQVPQLDARVGELFGSRAADPAGETTAPAPLVLTGVIAYPDPLQGFGILGTEPGHAVFYRVGAELPNAARLVGVYADRVEIERAGVREVLRLPLGLAPAGHLVQMAAASTETEEPTPAPAKSHGHALAEGFYPPGPEEGKAAAVEYWTQVHLGMERTDSDGHFLGYKLRGVGGKNDEGLRSGDVLMAINGAPVGERGRVSQLLDSDQSVSLTVLRNGSTVVITLPPGGPVPAGATPAQPVSP